MLTMEYMLDGLGPYSKVEIWNHPYYYLLSINLTTIKIKKRYTIISQRKKFIIKTMLRNCNQTHNCFYFKQFL